MTTTSGGQLLQPVSFVHPRVTPLPGGPHGLLSSVLRSRAPSLQVRALLFRIYFTFIDFED